MIEVDGGTATVSFLRCGDRMAQAFAEDVRPGVRTANRAAPDGEADFAFRISVRFAEIAECQRGRYRETAKAIAMEGGKVLTMLAPAWFGTRPTAR